MFHMSSSSQTRPVYKQPPVAFGQVRFGKTARAKDNQFQSMESALKKAMPKYQYTIGEDLFNNYETKLTFNRARAQTNYLWDTVKGSDLETFDKTDKLGLIEESSDMFFEMYTLKALYGGLVTPKQVKEWARLLPRVPQGADTTYQVTDAALLNGTQFKAFREKIRQDIKLTAEKDHPHRLKSFEKMVNKGWDAQLNNQAQNRALDILSLVGMKCALMTKKDPNYHLIWDNYKFLYGEGEELREEMAGDSKMDRPKKWLVAGLSMLYTLPGMPANLFRKAITDVVSEELGKDFQVDYKDLMETVYSKQIGRQELDYSRPDIDNKLKGDAMITLSQDALKKGNAKRKCILKPYELWQEAAVLNNAKVENKHRKPVESVLHTGA